MEKIEFEFRLTLKEYRNGVSYLSKSQWLTRILYFVGSICILDFLFSLDSSNEVETEWNLLFIGIALLVLIPYLIYRSIAKRYNSLPRIRELVKYSVSENEIQVIGESYNITLKTANVLKVKETKLILFFYENKTQAHLIPKRVLNESDLKKLKEILNK
tara:strand:+ start:751 stop:1227 length:477 start_codon:yes stop_codon:yes gene_type:complete